ncbi:peptidase S8/S53 domain-containing protein [Syncephalastrum racemosum]|uniref:Peptidase S8/S53 domain-containing protein n=1 Tax=Syncephalastrum racemosum TaxID=13706 RepID=A0A1X2HWC5_SYNRA|nr:peptidase S8/S53 domain-containing protein [Syncephalastrum racemosum]
MRFLLTLLLLLFASIAFAYVSAVQPSNPAPRYKRDHARRHYFTLYTPHGDRDAVEAVASELGARLEGPVGQLTQYYWISIPRSLKRRYDGNDDKTDDGDEENQSDEAVERLQARFAALQRSSKTKRGLASKVNRLDRQIPRRRLYKRAIPSINHTRERRQEDGLEPPLFENIQQETQLNQESVSTSAFLDGPGGFQALRDVLGIHDPGFEYQWHLVNQKQRGNDINVTGVWAQGITGRNVVVAILDDGLDMGSQDLADNFFAEGSYDFNARTALPSPKLEDDNHGTRCAGEIAAARNDVCGVGVAYDAKVAGIRILSEDITDADEAEALNYAYQQNHIYSCSWGPPDLGEVAEAPQGIVLDAIKNGIQHGRNGTGTIFVFASGNGGANDDNCNFDGYTNSMYTITVGAIDRMGNHPYYAERCSAQLVVTYSSGSGGHIYTTDVGERTCSERHGGTSAAAPLAAGVFALVLSVRPDLTWRDMQYLCVETALPISIEDTDWATLPSGRMYNHKFGFGKLDAYAIVEAAKTFQSVRAQTYLQLAGPHSEEKQPIPDLTTDSALDKSKAFTNTVVVTQAMLDAAGLGRLEHVTATVNIEHGRRGDLETLLESPSAVVSQLGAPRKFDTSTEGFKDWTFMSVKHWGENPVGNWTLRVVDAKNPQFSGYFINWTLTLWGEMADGFEGTPIHIPVSASQGEQTPEEAIPDETEQPVPPPSESVQGETRLPELAETLDGQAETPLSTSSASEVEDENESAETETKRPSNAWPNEEHQDDHRSFFARVVVVLLVFVGAAGCVYLIKRYTKQRNKYIGVPNQDENQYEFDVIQHGSPQQHKRSQRGRPE